MLATNGFSTFAIYLYADGLIQWTSSDDQGGVGGLNGDRPARAGYDARDSINHFTIPGSGTASIINITQTSNVGIPGTWMFQLHKSGIMNVEY